MVTLFFMGGEPSHGQKPINSVQALFMRDGRAFFFFFKREQTFMTDFVSVFCLRLLSCDRNNHPTVNKNTMSSASRLHVFVFAEHPGIPLTVWELPGFIYT